LKSRGNALKHGLTATTIDVLPTEDSLAFDEHVNGWVEDLDPSNRAQLGLVQLAAQMVWKLRRADAVQTARITTQVEKALSGETERLAAASLIERLFHNPQGPDALYGAGQYDDHREPRISWSPVVDTADRPATLLIELQGTAAGCALLLNEWETLRSRLEPGQAWVAQDTFRAVRLLGCNPLDALSVQNVAQLFVASAALARSDREPFAPLMCELDDQEYPVFVERVKTRWAGMQFDDPEEGRRGLLSIIDERIADLKAQATEYEENAESDAIRLAHCMSFDGSREGELLRRYEGASQRALSRALGDLLKLKRAERDQTLTEKGRTRGQVDTAGEGIACDGFEVAERVDSQAADAAEEIAVGDALSGQFASPASKPLLWDCETTSGEALADNETKSPCSNVVGETESDSAPANYETKSPRPAEAVDRTNSGAAPADSEMKSATAAADCETKSLDVDETVDETKFDGEPANYETKSPDSNAGGETKSDSTPSDYETKSPDRVPPAETKSAAVYLDLEAKPSGRDYRFETKRSGGENGPHWLSRPTGPTLARAVQPRASRAERRMAKALRKSMARELRSREEAARRSDRMAAGNSSRRLERSRAGGAWEPDRELATFDRSPLLKALPGSDFSQLAGACDVQAAVGAVFEPALLLV
jgi:hypothetical protein